MPVITTRSDMEQVRYHAVFRRSTMRLASAMLQLAAAAALVAVAGGGPDGSVRSTVRADAGEAAVDPVHPRAIHRDDDLEPPAEADRRARDRDRRAALARADDLHGSRAPHHRHRRHVTHRRLARSPRARDDGHRADAEADRPVLHARDDRTAAIDVRDHGRSRPGDPRGRSRRHAAEAQADQGGARAARVVDRSREPAAGADADDVPGRRREDDQARRRHRQRAGHRRARFRSGPNRRAARRRRRLEGRRRPARPGRAPGGTRRGASCAASGAACA